MKALFDIIKEEIVNIPKYIKTGINCYIETPKYFLGNLRKSEDTVASTAALTIVQFGEPLVYGCLVNQVVNHDFTGIEGSIVFGADLLFRSSQIAYDHIKASKKSQMNLVNNE